MRKNSYLRKTVLPVLTICGTALFPFPALAVQSGAAGNQWDSSSANIESILNGISSSAKTPKQTNQITYAPEHTTTTPGTSLAGNVIYRDQNGNVIGSVDASKASAYEQAYIKAAGSASSNRGTLSTTSSLNSSKNSTSGTSGTSRTSTASSSQKSVYESGGPGSSNVTAKTDDSTAAIGPSVTDAVLTETYYEDYDIYSLSVQDQYYFYANIGNNGITDKPVSVDIPENMSFTVTKDGVPMEYTRKQVLSDTGTYVFRITMVENPEDPVSRQKILRANYHFRIQPKAVKPKEEQAAAAQSSSGGQQTQNSYSPDVYLSNLEANNQNSQNSSQNSSQSGQSSAGSNSQNGQSGSSADSLPDGLDVFNMDSNENQASNEENRETESGSSAVDDALGLDFSNLQLSLDGEDEKASEDDSPLEEELEKISYDYDKAMYKIPFAGGKALYATVPNGMMTNYPVSLDTEELPSELKFLKDGVAETIPDGGSISEPGSYELLASDGNRVYTYSFRIIGNAENDLTYYTIPYGITLKAFYIDDILQTSDSYTNKNGAERVKFAQDGVYRLVMQDELGAEFDVELIRDVNPPVVNVTVSKGLAQITYGNRAEIDKVVLRSGKTEQELSAIDQVTKPGNYVMDVYDRAGNCTTVSFRVRGEINVATIVSVILLVGIIAAFAVLFVRTKKDNNVA